MKEEYLNIETAKKLANYDKAIEQARYYKSEWENVTRLVISKNRELTQLKKENTKLKKELMERD